MYIYTAKEAYRRLNDQKHMLLHLGQGYAIQHECHAIDKAAPLVCKPSDECPETHVKGSYCTGSD